ncbi:TPA: hydratase, partial [Klebsiella quasipneumoniae]|nr:hydratase [Klebsiella quasipneumoniae]
MITLHEHGVYLSQQHGIIAEQSCSFPVEKEIARKGTISWSILSSHSRSGDERKLKIKFDSMASHDLTFVGIIQTAKASGMTRFPLPYVL